MVIFVSKWLATLATAMYQSAVLYFGTVCFAVSKTKPKRSSSEIHFQQFGRFEMMPACLFILKVRKTIAKKTFLGKLLHWKYRRSTYWTQLFYCDHCLNCKYLVAIVIMSSLYVAAFPKGCFCHRLILETKLYSNVSSTH